CARLFPLQPQWEDLTAAVAELVLSSLWKTADGSGSGSSAIDFPRADTQRGTPWPGQCEKRALSAFSGPRTPSWCRREKRLLFRPESGARIHFAPVRRRYAS